MSSLPLLRALAQALNDPYAFLTVVVEAEDRATAVHALRERYGWDEHQSDLMMSLSMQRLTQADRSSVLEEFRLAGGFDAEL